MLIIVVKVVLQFNAAGRERTRNQLEKFKVSLERLARGARDEANRPRLESGCHCSGGGCGTTTRKLYERSAATVTGDTVGRNGRRFEATRELVPHSERIRHNELVASPRQDRENRLEWRRRNSTASQKVDGLASQLDNSARESELAPPECQCYAAPAECAFAGVVPLASGAINGNEGAAAVEEEAHKSCF